MQRAGVEASNRAGVAEKRERDAVAAAVVQRAQDGDAAALPLLFAGISTRVWSVAYHLIGDEHEAEDVRQDTFLAIHARLGTLSDVRAFEGWAMRIARNVAVDRARRMARCRPSLRAHDEATDEVRDLPRVLRRSGTAEVPPGAQLLLREAFAQLPAEIRETVRLRYVDGLSCKEVAHVQGLGASCVKTRLHRARRALADAATQARWRPR